MLKDLKLWLPTALIGFLILVDQWAKKTILVSIINPDYLDKHNGDRELKRFFVVNL